VAGADYGFAEVIARAYQSRISLSATGFYRTPGLNWDRIAGRGRPFFYFAYGAAVSEVVIDTLTGEYRILRADILHDCGASLNPALDIGQIEGGYVQGAGWLTTEELVWDGKGRLRTHAPSTYKIPAMGDRPRVFNVALWNGRNRGGDDPPLEGRGRAAPDAGHLGADGAVGCGGGLRRRVGLSPRSTRRRRRSGCWRRWNGSGGGMAIDRDASPRRCPRAGRGAGGDRRASRIGPARGGHGDAGLGGGQSGTIGGGALEFEAARRAPGRCLPAAGPRVEKVPLGPGLGQCCGGAVTLVYERFTMAELAALPRAARMPARSRPRRARCRCIRRALKTAREEGAAPVLLSGGWLVEPIARPARALWIWGAGHVGRALVGVLAPLPAFALTWIDTRRALPGPFRRGVTIRAHPDPGRTGRRGAARCRTPDPDLQPRARPGTLPPAAAHGFAEAGLIGSASKWARFRSRSALGHPDAQIARIRCPIGDPSLGKHPQAIAVGVAAGLLRQGRSAERDSAG
jgi:xanthine dehydrogenase accessory factor